LIAFAIVGLLACGIEPTAPEPSGKKWTAISVEGVVTHDRTGLPMSDWPLAAWVWESTGGINFTTRHLAETHTDDAGYYAMSFNGFCSRDSDYAASLGSHLNAATLLCTEGLQVFNFEIIPVGEPHLEYFGTVTSSDGDPIEGAIVDLRDGEGELVQRERTYGAEGHYQMENRSYWVLDLEDSRHPFYLEASCGDGCPRAPHRTDVTSCFQEVNFVLDPVPPAASGR
jgi:hypothetical protein